MTYPNDPQIVTPPPGNFVIKGAPGLSMVQEKATLTRPLEVERWRLASPPMGQIRL